MDLHSIHPMELLHPPHASHPGKYLAYQTLSMQRQMVNHNGSCHHTTNCTTPSCADSGMPSPDTNHRDIHCKSSRDMASNIPTSALSVLPYLCYPGSGYSMVYQLSVTLLLIHH